MGLRRTQRFGNLVSSNEGAPKWVLLVGFSLKFQGVLKKNTDTQSYRSVTRVLKKQMTIICRRSGTLQPLLLGLWPPNPWDLAVRSWTVW